MVNFKENENLSSPETRPVLFSRSGIHIIEVVIVLDAERELSAVLGYLVKPFSTSLVGNDKLSRDFRGDT